MRWECEMQVEKPRPVLLRVFGRPPVSYHCRMAPSANNPDDRVRDLLRLGERLGYLTYEELNEKLPDEAVTPEKLDALLGKIDELGIRLINEADAPARW